MSKRIPQDARTAHRSYRGRLYSASNCLSSDDAPYASSRAVGPHAVEAVAVRDDHRPEATAEAGATAALGRSPGTAAHQAVELQLLSQGHECRGGILERIGLAQPPPSMGALNRIVRRLPFPKYCQQFRAHWVKLVVPPTGSDRVPVIFARVPDHAIEPHVTATDPDEE